MKLSLEELKVAVADYVKSNKIGVTTFTETRNNIIGLLDKIGKIVTLDTNFYDKLPELDGEELMEGKTVEEYYQDLIMPVDYNQDSDGSRALKFYSPTYRPVCYSYTLGKKVIPESIPNNNIERAVNKSSQYVGIVALMTKRLSDSADAYKYQCKREMLGKICDKVVDAYTNATAYVDATTKVEEGKFYKQTISSVVHTAVCVVTHEAEVGDDWAGLVADGILIELNMMKVVSLPVDTETGEAFIKILKEQVEIAQDINEGHSFNGNTIGAEIGLQLYIKHGVMPSVEVDTLAGAFNPEKLSVNVEQKVIKDFGATTSKAFAILMDKRGARLHNDYQATREDTNGFGDFLSLFRHLEYTAFISRNTFFTIFVTE